MYRLDRTKFKAMTAEEADKETRNYKNASLVDFFKIAMYLNSMAYNFSVNDPPKMDRSAFKAIGRK